MLQCASDTRGDPAFVLARDILLVATLIAYVRSAVKLQLKVQSVLMKAKCFQGRCHPRNMFAAVWLAPQLLPKRLSRVRRSLRLVCLLPRSTPDANLPISAPKCGKSKNV